jgi:hypothetical protein
MDEKKLHLCPPMTCAGGHRLPSQTLWPHRRMTLWHPESPGLTVHVDVLWPRFMWVLGDKNGRPRDFATLNEVQRMHRGTQYRNYDRGADDDSAQ